MLKTPDFWTKKNLPSFALLPISFIYFVGFYLIKFFSKPEQISKPVICIGNIIAGGAGKTPTAIAVGEILNEIGVKFAFLSRGYMNDGSKFLMLHNHDNNKAEQVGDESLLLIKVAPTFVAKDRLFGAKQIEKMKQFEAIILDDGMQCNSLKRDFTILVIDGKIGFGNDFMIPAGPMRETLSSGLQKTDLVVLVGDADEKLTKKLANKKIIKAKISPKNLDIFLGKKLIAFCGLAYPKKFFSLLENEGLEVIESIGFADHYQYKSSDLELLLRSAEEKNAKLITTKKDWVKFPKSFQEKISYLDINLVFENTEILKSELKKLLKI
ncbi:MAG: tetraacyldisaccharide 4'-kinase [Proteobacteria bacterium]|nr:tetraacyldisaccharide 4'-kinase [Pseudomonadota bacterium]